MRTIPSTGGAPRFAVVHDKRWIVRVCLVLLGIAAWAMTAPLHAHAQSNVESTPTPTTTRSFEDRNILWTLVHQRCVSKAERRIFPPAPCTDVELGQGGYAIFKDRDGPYQYLLLPLARITGIESPALLAPDAANYFAAAWKARLYVDASLHASQPRGVVSLAINSSLGRSQDQLHIHIDCVRGDVQDAIHRWLPRITPDWRPLPEGLPPFGHRYAAKWVSGENLRDNPLKDLASALPRNDTLATHSLLVMGAYSPSGAPGFVLLSGRADTATGDRAHAEELQDTTCAIAQHPP
ncbi:CDP-diacylglycerol diphosphatase [Dyella psychrodurans]|uniref:CDP-diacylglycerol pyrophosphatase n=1 Tax=Dyella psychrodurans TaxID=1927960 RepID=A0A370XD13_9GAMM|nr:CDP-diacylglycerol diphosphatase [Dyella psychrodurans]RDS86324.1 CDP-diacylglycerol diphosphatase [Dyella psychrodurans]